MSHELFYLEVNRESAERESVFNGLVEIRDEGRNVSQFIAEQLLKGKRVVIASEPGNGKTSIIQGAASVLERNGKEARFFFYDQALAEEQRRLGLTTDKWNLDMWRRFNFRMYENFGDANIIELPAVGKDDGENDERDRGLTSFKMLCKDAQEGKGQDTVFVFVVRNNLLQLWSGLLRQHILAQEPGDVFTELERYNVLIRGIPKDERGALLVQGLFKRTGQIEHMRKIRNEEDDKINRWMFREEARMLDAALAENPRATRDATAYDVLAQRSAGMVYPPRLTTEMLMEIYESFGIQTEGIRDVITRVGEISADSTMRQAVFMEHIFRGVDGFDKNRAVIVHNPFVSTPKVVDMKLLKSLL